MLKKKVSFERALQIVKRGRPIAEPNPGFVAQLSAFEAEAHSLNFEAHVLDLLTEKPIPGLLFQSNVSFDHSLTLS